MTIVSHQTFQTTYVEAGSKANAKNEMTVVIPFILSGIFKWDHNRVPFIFPNNMTRTLM